MQKILVYPRSTFAGFVHRRKTLFEKKKPSSDRVDLIILNYHASTKTYNIKITRSRRERKYVPPIVSFDHSSICQQEKYNVTIIIKSRRKWIIVRGTSYSFLVPFQLLFSGLFIRSQRVWLLSTRANLFSLESIGKQFCVHSFY